MQNFDATAIVAILSGFGTMFTAIYIGIGTYRDKVAEKHRKAEEASNKLLIDDMMKSVDFNKKETILLKEAIKVRDSRIQELEKQVNTIQNDCQERSLELIKSLNLKDEQLKNSDTQRVKSESEVHLLREQILVLQKEISEIRKEIREKKKGE